MNKQECYVTTCKATQKKTTSLVNVSYSGNVRGITWYTITKPNMQLIYSQHKKSAKQNFEHKQKWKCRQHV